MRDNKTVIRKYENRRLYDTAHSRYVNLEEIAQMIRDGADVQVVDARTGEDITRVILTQIIVDDARDQNSALPLDLLQQLVAASGRASQESFSRYLKAFFDSYRHAYDAFQARMQPPRTVPNPFDFMQSLFTSGAPAAGPVSGGAPPPPEPPGPPQDERNSTAQAGSELDELRRRIADLERQLRKPRERAARPRSSSRR